MIAALLPCAIAAPAAELSTTGDILDGIAAIVNEGVVLKSELHLQTETITKRAREQGMQLPPPDILQEQVLESLIVKRIQLQRAERIGIQVSDQLLMLITRLINIYHLNQLRLKPILVSCISGLNRLTLYIKNLGINP